MTSFYPGPSVASRKAESALTMDNKSLKSTCSEMLPLSRLLGLVSAFLTKTRVKLWWVWRTDTLFSLNYHMQKTEHVGPLWGLIIAPSRRFFSQAWGLDLKLSWRCCYVCISAIGWILHGVSSTDSSVVNVTRKVHPVIQTWKHFGYWSYASL